jgi:GDP-fucose protein O-fucosyltransferase
MLPKLRKARWNHVKKYRRVIVASLSGLLAVLYVGVLFAWSSRIPHHRNTNNMDGQKGTKPYKLRNRPAHVAPSQLIERELKQVQTTVPIHTGTIKADAKNAALQQESSALTSPTQPEKNTPAPAKLATTTPPKQEASTSGATTTATTTTAGEQPQQPPHVMAGLSCEAHGGPADAAALNEMIYWKDIPSDASYVTPLLQGDDHADGNDGSSAVRYFTFEPDEGGFNNIRMAMETAIALAIAMGRTLVLPPKMHFYLLNNGVVDYGSFFHIDSIAAEHGHFDIITFEEFLQREALTGHLKYANGTVAFPPQDNRTDWDRSFRNHEATRHGSSKELWEYMRNVSQPLNWKPDDCVAGIPTDPQNATKRLQEYVDQVLYQDSVQFPSENVYGRFAQRTAQYRERPLPVDTTSVNRLSELLANRREICAYNETYQNARVVHAMGETSTGYRLLVHWYAYIFFEDWRQDLHMKRFMRDHFRYKDEIQCAAARIIQAVRRKTQEHGNQVFDTMHIRRGDFQYTDVKIDALQIYENNTKEIIPEGSTVYIATDESNRTFFEPLAAHYKLLFFSDFEHLVEGVSKNYYGMLDQLVASKGRYFFGTYYSTFSGYINRLRGYHSQNSRAPGYEMGIIDSYYYVPEHLKSLHSTMRSYNPVQPGYWMQEFPVAWRLIDTGVADDAVTTSDALPARRR